MADELLLGFDVGTSSIKAAIFGLDGTCVAVAARPIPLSRPRREICEVDPRAYWDGLCGCCAELWEQGVEPERVRALAVAAHAETLLVLDDGLEPVRPGIVWLDTRSTREAADLGARLGFRELSELSGQPQMIPMWPATKVLWLRRHEPESVAAARWWLQPLDYLSARLVGRVASERSEYSSSLLLDIRTRDWWEPMLVELAIERSALPELVPAATSLGAVTAEARAQLGLAPETLVVMGGFDQACTGVGAGNVRAGIVSESTGTSLALISTVDSPPTAAATVPCHLHVVPDRYFLNAHHPAAGSLLDWFRDELARELSVEELDRLAGSVDAGSDGLVVLPYVSGTATPSFDPLARGVVFGLTLRHQRRHLVRGLLEGVALALADLVDEHRRLGVEPRELRSVGGGAKSHVWSQIKADVTGLPIRVVAAADHAGALGAAILAGVGSGALPSVEEGADALVRLLRTFEPNLEHAAAYARARRVYQELYPRLRELFHASAEVT